MKFIATVESRQRAKIETIAKAMRDSGIHVDKVLKATGIITGRTNGKSLKDINIAGVLLAEQKNVHI